MTNRDPHAVAQPNAGEAVQHEPRLPAGGADEAEKRDPPGKPFRTPSKNKTHPAPHTGTDGDPLNPPRDKPH